MYIITRNHRTHESCGCVSRSTHFTYLIQGNNVGSGTMTNQADTEGKGGSNLRKGTPITVILLYLWCESHFFMHKSSNNKNLDSDPGREIGKPWM